MQPLLKECLSTVYYSLGEVFLCVVGREDKEWNKQSHTHYRIKASSQGTDLKHTSALYHSTLRSDDNYQLRLFMGKILKIYLGVCHVFCIPLQHISALSSLFKILYIITTIGKLEYCLLIWIYKRLFLKKKSQELMYNHFIKLLWRKLIFLEAKSLRVTNESMTEQNRNKNIIGKWETILYQSNFGNTVPWMSSLVHSEMESYSIWGSITTSLPSWNKAYYKPPQGRWREK